MNNIGNYITWEIYLQTNCCTLLCVGNNNLYGLKKRNVYWSPCQAQRLRPLKIGNTLPIQCCDTNFQFKVS